MALSDAVLARRQKDLEGYVEKYQAIIDRRAAQYGKDLLPTWKAMGRKCTDAIRRFYEQYADENGKLPDAKIGQAERLQLMQQLLANIVRAAQGQPEKLKRNLAYHIANGYYYSAFSLEQAAQVRVTVPLLTEQLVMGILANPWLPDGATYSDRIRANTAFLGQKMRETMDEAIGQGLSVHHTAERIQEIAGEGWGNSVRLARTEMRRAYAQGANQAYMQNADILDGKRWNATLDGKTAPKDAANDGKIYPLDYDTPESPGHPGERIPNHPNCRCHWTPVLSALGVSTKERIARDQSTSETNYGKNVYTKARTYKEYAKANGLPDLDERLANDNPSSYLRRGETLNDYKTGSAGKLPTPPEPKAPAPKTEPPAAAWADAVRNRISKGLNTEADHREVGSMIRAEIEKRSGDTLTKKQMELDDGEAAQESLWEQIIEAGKTRDAARYGSPEYDAATKRWHELSDSYYDKGSELQKLKDEIRDLTPDIRREVLSEVRPLGADKAQAWAKGTQRTVKDAFETIAKYLPTDWLNTSAADLPLEGKSVQRGYYQHSVRTGVGKYRLSGSGRSMEKVAVHEMGHRFEAIYPQIRRLEHEFYQRRTQGERLQWLGGGCSKSEKARFDKFIHPYMGKDYGSTETSYYELLSMGLEGLFRPTKWDITKDPDFMDFILGLFAGV